MKYIKRTNENNSIFIVEMEDTKDRKKGVYIETELYNAKTQTTTTKITKVCSLCYIEEKILVDRANFYKVAFYDRDRKNIKYIEAKDLLTTSVKNSYDLDDMINRGLVIEEKCRGFVIEYFKLLSETVEEKQGTEKTGWNNGQYIGNGFNTSDIVYAGKSSVSFNTNGSKQEQVDLFNSVFKENPLIFFVTAYCYAGIISQHILNGEANPILGITGISSSGKTTAEKLITSGYTHPDKFISLNSTSGNLEAVIREHNDLFVCADESGESKLKPEEKIAFIYSIANGRSKGRLQRFGDVYRSQEVETKKYSLLICGEESLLNGLKKTDGINVRLNELVLTKDLTLWDQIQRPLDENDIETKQSNNAFIEDLTKKLYSNYGFIVPEFIDLVKQDLHLLNKEFTYQLEVTRQELKSSSDIVNRKAKILAYTYVAAKYLARVVFKNDEIDDIPDYLYQMIETAKRALFSDIADFEESRDTYKDLLAHIEDTHQQYFITDNEDITRKEVIGEIKIKNDFKEILIPNNMIARFYNVLGVPDNVFMSYLKNNNLLKRDKDGKSTISRNRKRYYCINIPLSFFEEKEKIVSIVNQDEIDDDVPVFPAEE